jgi:hypothetical protein
MKKIKMNKIMKTTKMKIISNSRIINKLITNKRKVKTNYFPNSKKKDHNINNKTLKLRQEFKS